MKTKSISYISYGITKAERGDNLSMDIIATSDDFHDIWTSTCKKASQYCGIVIYSLYTNSVVGEFYYRDGKLINKHNL